MKYLSVCSGIEAASTAWHSLGWEALAFSEIKPFPRKVLAHHYPDVPLHGDFTILREQDWIKDADILVGGTPCQAFSVAGLRNSLNDDRGNLTLEFVRLADAIDDFRPIGDGTIIVWENVPGILSVKDNAFGCFLAALVGNDAPLVPTGGKWTNAGMVMGPKRRAAWRVLDAQYFGVAQRRRRVFVVASARDGFDPAEVLFEREGLRQDTPPSREKGQKPSATIATGFRSSGNNHEECVSMTLQARMGAAGFDLETETAIVQCFDRQRSEEYGEADIASTMSARDYKSASDLVAQPIMASGPSGGNQGGDYIVEVIALSENTIGRKPENGGNGVGFTEGGPMYTLNATGVHGVNQSMAVRRLTPRECERLQGFPDDYTNIPGAADGPRYKALGNSMAVPVMAWIGKRIKNYLKSNLDRVM